MTSSADISSGGAFLVFLGTLGLAFVSAIVERAALARVNGLRRPPLLGPVADAAKVMARSGRPAPGAGAAAFAALLPALALVALLPPGAGVGGLSLPGVAPGGGTVQALLLVALLAVSVQAWLLPAALAGAEGQRALMAGAGAIIGCHLAVLLVAAALVIDGGPVLAAYSRTPGAWPVWSHPAGAAAWVGTLAILCRCTGSVLGGRRAGLRPASGTAPVWLSLSRYLQMGAAALLAYHLFGGGLPAAAGWVEILPGLTAAAVLASAVVLGSSLSDGTPAGLARAAWTCIVPLALIDLALSVLRSAGWLPWS